MEPTNQALSAEEPLYTDDGTLDIHKRPANKKKTGSNECCQRLAYYGMMSTNLVNYLHDRFGLGNASFSTIYVIGKLVLTFSAVAPGLKHVCHGASDCHPTTGQTAALFIALYLIALGTGGIKPCVSSFFNWFYSSINVGALIASSVLVWIQMNVGWGWGFGIPAVAMIIAIIFSSSVVDGTACKYPVAAPLYSAAVETDSDRIKNLPNSCIHYLEGQIEEFKSVIRLLQVWALLIAFGIHIGPNFKIPSTFLSLFDDLSSIILADVYDGIIVPFARKFTGHKRRFPELQRIGIGLIISIVSMVVAGILEVVRLNMVWINNYYDLETIPLSIFWQVPQYFFIGAAGVFANIGQIEFFYGKAPDAMRSLCLALSLMTNALGNYFSTLLVTIVIKVTTSHGRLGWILDNLNRGHLDYFYWLLTLLILLNFLVYLWIAKRYKYKIVPTNGR
ncbi:hypothetical protein AAHE18_12G147900 [Arachis hypogaea]